MRPGHHAAFQLAASPAGSPDTVDIFVSPGLAVTMLHAAHMTQPTLDDATRLQELHGMAHTASPAHLNSNGCLDHSAGIEYTMAAGAGPHPAVQEVRAGRGHPEQRQQIKDLESRGEPRWSRTSVQICGREPQAGGQLPAHNATLSNDT